MLSTCRINDEVQGTNMPISYQDGQEYTSKWFPEWLPKDRNTEERVISYHFIISGVMFSARIKEDPKFEVQTVSTKEKSVLDKIESKIFNRLVFPSHWSQEGISRPNMQCKLDAFDICKHLFKEYNMIPDRIAPTKEEGIFLAFDSSTGDRTLIVEVYNDLEAGYLVNDNTCKQILLSEDITDYDFAVATNLING